MTQAPAFVWEAYRHAQTSSDRPSIDHFSWGADEAAEAILILVEDGATLTSPEALAVRLRNLFVNRATKHRRRNAIKSAHFDPIHAGERTPSAFDAVAARIRLRELRAKSRPADWLLLEAVGIGSSYAEIADDGGSTETAIKKRVARARDRLAA